MTCSQESVSVPNAVVRDLCCGCGMCAAVCPQNAVTMDWGTCGELVPKLASGNCTECGLCSQVCPTDAHRDDQTLMAQQSFGNHPAAKYTPQTGPYLQSYVGFARADGHRQRGASGGLVTWLLEALLTRGEIDGVVTVRPQRRSVDRLFGYDILRDASGLRQAANSVYYPVELSAALRSLAREDNQRTYAVVALPCRAYALRRAMARSAVLRRKIRFIIGLTCGQLPNRFFTEYCATTVGLAPDRIARVWYRSMVNAKQAGDYSMAIAGSEGEAASIPYQPLQHHLLANSYFIHQACYFCDDVFAETADATFMDAWLPAYGADTRGTSLVITRHPQLDAFLRTVGGDGGQCNLSEVGIADVIASQAGVISRKRRMLGAKLAFASAHRLDIPPRRVKPSLMLYLAHAAEIRVTYDLMHQSKSAWQAARATADVAGFHRTLAGLEQRLAAVERRRRLFSYPRAACGAVARRVRPASDQRGDVR